MPTGRRYLTSYPVVIDQKLTSDIKMIFVQNSSSLISDVSDWPFPNKIPGCATGDGCYNWGHGNFSKCTSLLEIVKALHLFFFHDVTHSRTRNSRHCRENLVNFFDQNYLFVAE